MLVSGMRGKQLFLGMVILFIGSTSSAAMHKSSKEEPKKEPTKISDIPVPVLQPGTRVCAGDPQKNEFYVLRRNEKDPVTKTPGHEFVNAEPLQSGIETDNILNTKPETIIDANNLVHEQTEEVNPAADQQPEQASNAPAAMDADAVKEEEVHDDSNLGKVKTLLHKLTRKMADKKKHSRTKLASYSKKALKLHAKKKHKIRAVALKHESEHEPELTVIRMKFVG